MKNIKYLLIFLFGYLNVCPIDAQNSDIQVTIEIAKGDNNYLVKRFDKSATFFTNRDYKLDNIPASFIDYSFISSEGANVDHFVIIPSADGYIYALASKMGFCLPGWSTVENSACTYMAHKPAYMSVYKRKVKKGERIELLSDKNNFIGISPLAKDIVLSPVSTDREARLRSISIDGEDVKWFMSDTSKHTYYLPYTYDRSPDIIPEPFAKDAMVKITKEILNIRGTEQERTLIIKVTSPDRTVVNQYAITFEVLPALDLYICIGQSNMQGYAPFDEELGDFEFLDNVFLLNDMDYFEKAVNPLNRFSNVKANIIGELGPSFSFSKEISSYSKNPIGLIVNAKGGSSINSWIKEASDNLYGLTMKRVREAQKWGKVKAILWHQGERDRNEYEVYPEKLKKLVTDFRNDLNDDNIVFVAGQIGRWIKDSSDFNEMISTVDSFIAKSTCVSSKGLTNIDNAHFDRRSAIILGERYAEAIRDCCIKE